MQLRDLEDLVDLGIDAAKLELGLELGSLLVELDELAKGRRGHEIDRRKVDDYAVFVGLAQRGVDVVEQSGELRGINEAIVLYVDGEDAVFARGLNGHGTVRRGKVND